MKISVSLEASWKTNGFHNGFQWVPARAIFQKFNVFLETAVISGMGSRLGSSGFQYL